MFNKHGVLKCNGASKKACSRDGSDKRTESIICSLWPTVCYDVNDVSVSSVQSPVTELASADLN